MKANLKRQYPEAEIEVWAFDEHRVGLKPILRKVWSRVGQRPVAPVHHRYEWLYAYGFVYPSTGQTEWYLLPRVNVAWLNAALKAFAHAVGAGVNKHILLAIAIAGGISGATLLALYFVPAAFLLAKGRQRDGGDYPPQTAADRVSIEPSAM